MTPRAHFTYVVEQKGKHWTVGFGPGTHIGQFPSRRQALESAVRDAVRVRVLGAQVDVLARRKDGSLRKIPEGISLQ